MFYTNIFDVPVHCGAATAPLLLSDFKNQLMYPTDLSTSRKVTLPAEFCGEVFYEFSHEDKNFKLYPSPTAL